MNRTIRENVAVAIAAAIAAAVAARRPECGWKVTRDEIVSGFAPDCGLA